MTGAHGGGDDDDNDVWYAWGELQRFHSSLSDHPGEHNPKSQLRRDPLQEVRRTSVPIIAIG
eukprot:1396082-Karenia_brevis.AAC.1